MRLEKIGKAEMKITQVFMVMGLMALGAVQSEAETTFEYPYDEYGALLEKRMEANNALAKSNKKREALKDKKDAKAREMLRKKAAWSEAKKEDTQRARKRLESSIRDIESEIKEARKAKRDEIEKREISLKTFEAKLKRLKGKIKNKRDVIEQDYPQLDISLREFGNLTREDVEQASFNSFNSDTGMESLYHLEQKRDRLSDSINEKKKKLAKVKGDDMNVQILRHKKHQKKSELSRLINRVPKAHRAYETASKVYQEAKAAYEKERSVNETKGQAFLQATEVLRQYKQKTLCWTAVPDQVVRSCKNMKIKLLDEETGRCSVTAQCENQCDQYMHTTMDYNAIDLGNEGRHLENCKGSIQGNWRSCDLSDPSC